ncbi:hypothetical protein C2I19_13325 [Chromobacterium alticapitis]|uniref:Uncharacterized protein n=1 Tax=Chromobacterium alticapitis TaxID=2073169 RepID=A0A2S5DES8_9NEIS|nr:hypothetical protein C2I19_13325 [Chromobacterium alticapitis]
MQKAKSFVIVARDEDFEFSVPLTFAEWSIRLSMGRMALGQSGLRLVCLCASRAWDRTTCKMALPIE